MKLRLLVAVAALGCSESTSPDLVLPPLTLGGFALVSVDGQPLPRQLTLAGHACGVSEGAFVLSSDTTLYWELPCDPPATTVLFGWSGAFRQVAVDSFVAPRLPPQSSVSPTTFGSQKGLTLTVVTLSHHPFGAHSWVFSASP